MMLRSIGTSPSLRLSVAFLGVVTLALAGCTHAPERHFSGPHRGGFGLPKANFGLSNAIPVKVCVPGAGPCVINVGRTSGEPKLNEQTFTYECDVSVAELILSPKGVQSLRWTLPPNVLDKPRFRFRESTLKVDIGGVTAYAKNLTTFPFAPNRISDTEFEFVHKSPNNKIEAGYAYGIYLEWAAVGSTDWQVCTPLDPIIIEHN